MTNGIPKGTIILQDGMCDICGKSRNTRKHDKCSKIRQLAYQERERMRNENSSVHLQRADG